LLFFGHFTAGKSFYEFEQSLNLRRNVPSPSRRTRDEEASAKPQSFADVAFVAAGRILGGQLFLRPHIIR
jgi:hypothetical protein